MKLVIDTNVLSSALYSKKGASYALIKWLFQQEQMLSVVSTPLVIEYQDVLTRPEQMARYPQLSQLDIEGFIDDICHISWHQKIYYLWRPFLPDPKDDMILETAFNAGADYIITHNLRDFRQVRDNFNIQPIAPKDFWQLHKGEQK
ncbi:putative toxin-antitoxin system toxin component, PIN family [Thiofilum flexile]|uniref:putative toxin-antitoxin system toxin component, PIN family n=1 Tax=Thiofilum flexile TaxID=125627 RepID=UPI000372C256|nr:putative toxin-antitoxin system toxin component, PIN family [Thiofilum flexile]